MDEDTRTTRVNRKRRIIASDKRFACEYCNKKYFVEIRLKKHLKVHGIHIFTFESIIRSNLLMKISFHSGPDFSLVHKCDLCSLYFPTTELRAAHKIERHKERLTCKICDKFFRTLKTLESHNVAHHTGRIKRKPVACDDEDIASENENDRAGGSSVKKSKIQDEKQPFKCSIAGCDKRFSLNEYLYRHKLLHGNSSNSLIFFSNVIAMCLLNWPGPDGSLVHKCQCCHKYFASTEERDTHMLDAHKDKLSCTICDKTFHSVKATQSHYSYHHGRRDKSGEFLQFKSPLIRTCRIKNCL